MGNDADEADADEIIDMASKASLADQEKQVQENIHLQIKSFCTSMDEILLPDGKTKNEPEQSNSASRRSGLSFAVGRNSSPTNHPGEYLFDILFFFFRKLYHGFLMHWDLHLQDHNGCCVDMICVVRLTSS